MKIGAKVDMEEPRIIQELAREYDFLELFYLPHVPLKMEQWPLHINWVVHLPHSGQGVNLAAPRDKGNIDYMFKALEFASKIGAKRVVVHPGYIKRKGEAVGSVENFHSHMSELMTLAKKLRLRVLIENMPVESENMRINAISKPEEYAAFMKKFGCGFCLDFSHAVHAAFSYKIPYKEFIMEFMKLKPEYFHLYDTKTNQANDLHLAFGEGDFDIPFAISLVKDHWVTFELPREHALQHYLNAKKYLVERGFYP
jgi:deoxyribonuclease-4